MDRFRGLPSAVLIAIGSIVGFSLGGYLGLLTERGIPGLITFAGAIGGTVAGVYLAQLMAMAPRDEE